MTNLDRIAHRQYARRARDLAFSVLLAAVAVFSVAAVGTAGPTRTAEAATVAPAPAPIVEMDACAIELAC